MDSYKQTLQCKQYNTYIYDWVLDNTDIRIYGISMSNEGDSRETQARETQETICLRIEDFAPYVYLELPNNNPETIRGIQDAINPYVIKTQILNKTHLYEALNNNPESFFLFCQCESQIEIKQLLYFIRCGILLPGFGMLKLKMHEVAATPILQLVSLLNIPMAGWINFTPSNIITQTEQITSCEKEYIVPWKQLSPSSCTSHIEPKCLALDLEVNSSNLGAFPNDKPDDKIFQISCVIQETISNTKIPRKKKCSGRSPRDATEEVEPIRCSSGTLGVGAAQQAAQPGCAGPMKQRALAASPIIKIVGKKQIRKYLFSLPPNNIKKFQESQLLQDINCFICPDELTLIRDVLNFINYEKPNVFTGFNIFGFDIEYLLKRCNRYYLSDLLKSLGRNETKLSSIEQVKWSSQAFKNQEFNFVRWEGILILDMFKVVEQNPSIKLDTYTLENVASTFLNTSKDPVKVKDIFTAYRTRENMDVIGKYCVKDSELCIDLMNYFHTWIDLSIMAKVCNVSMFTLHTQGQQIKTYSQVYKYCLHNNIVVDTDGYDAKINEKFTGAYVIEPIPDYYEHALSFDFQSLYPSIIIAYNICYSTFAPKHTPRSQCHLLEWEDHIGCPHDPDIIKKTKLTEEIENLEKQIKKLMKDRDGLNMSNCPKGQVKNKKDQIQQKINKLRQKQKPFREERLTCKNPTKDKIDSEGNIISSTICEKRSYKFYKSTVKKGVIPIIIQNLLKTRAIIKEKMKHCSPEDRIYLDKEQQAYKISANSMYGGMGVKRGYLPFMPGAMCVTFLGRSSLLKTKELVQEKGKGKIIYGDTDSIYASFPHINDKCVNKRVAKLWDYAEQLATTISEEFPSPMKLKFEQAIYTKFIIFTKKRYMYLAVNKHNEVMDEIGKKGVILARRDNSKMLRNIYERIITMIFLKPPSVIREKKEKEKILQTILEFINDLFRNRIVLEDFIITTSVGNFEGDVLNGRVGDYKVTELPSNEIAKNKILNGQTEREYYISHMPGQVQLAEKLKKRGKPVNAGARLEYIIIKKPGVFKVGGKMEDYEYFKDRSWFLKPDTHYYLDSLINPLDQMLLVGLKEKNFILQQNNIRKTFDKCLREIRKKGLAKVHIQ